MSSRIAGALNATFALIPNRNASKPPCNKQQILDDNYDDQAWFALAWLSYADSDLLLPAPAAVSVRAAAVGRAVQIFENMARKAWDERHCGVSLSAASWAQYTNRCGVEVWGSRSHGPNVCIDLAFGQGVRKNDHMSPIY